MVDKVTTDYVVFICLQILNMFFRVELLPYDLITQLFQILTIDTKQEKGKDWDRQLRALY